MDTILSLIVHNPIIVLVVLGWIVMTYLKSAKSDETEEQDTQYGTTWEDMEREYGITIERKIETDIDSIDDSVETSTNQSVLATEMNTPVVIESTSQPQRESSSTVDVLASTESPVKSNRKRKIVAKTPTLEERLAAYNRDSVAQLERLEQPALSISAVEPVESNRKQRKTHSMPLKEGMKWSIILDKPLALRRRYH